MCHACVCAARAQSSWSSLWLLWGPEALWDMPFSALFWFNYELERSWLSGLRPKVRYQWASTVWLTASQGQWEPS